MKVRIISRLDIKGPNLVKGVNLEGLRVLGKPWEFAKAYYEDGIDELLYVDSVASLYGRNSLVDLIKLTAENIFIPLTVAGGIRTIEDITKILRAGADKVAINSAAIKNPSFIKEAVKKFGSSTVVVSIEAQKDLKGNYKCYIENGRQATDLDPIKWAIEVEKLGAGEILLTAVHKEGTGTGFDNALLKNLNNSIKIPVIASGGAGTNSDIKDIINVSKINAVCIASMFHYFMIENKKIKNVDKEYSEGNTSFLKSNLKGFKKETSSIENLKKYLIKNGIHCSSRVNS